MKTDSTLKTTESRTAAGVGTGDLVWRSEEKPTGYLIWDSGVLNQQWEYLRHEWTGHHWHATRETEWRPVPTKQPQPNSKDQP